VRVLLVAADMRREGCVIGDCLWSRASDGNIWIYFSSSVLFVVEFTRRNCVTYERPKPRLAVTEFKFELEIRSNNDSHLASPFG
jgi:hypothetical protein